MDLETIAVLGFVGVLLYLVSSSTSLSDVLSNVQTSSGPNVPTGGLLTIPQIANVASNAGFTGSDLSTAVAVALAESFPPGNASSLGDNNQSYGLWQIYTPQHAECGPDFNALFDPQNNANCAYSIYRAAGSSFSPWTTYNSGKYLTYLSQVQQALGVTA